MSLNRSLVVCAAATAVCALGCGPKAERPPDTAPPGQSAQTSATAQPAAPVDGFPDMSAFTEVDRRDYLVVVPHSPALKFVTPQGDSCWLGANAAPDQAYASCVGPRPDKGPGDWKVTATGVGPATVETASGDQPGLVDPTPLPLPPSHVLRNDPAQFCGVDDQGAVACRIGEHGFVLAPDSTRLF